MKVKQTNTLFIILNLFFLLSITTACQEKKPNNNLDEKTNITSTIVSPKETKKAAPTPTDEASPKPAITGLPKKGKLVKTKTGKEVLKAEKGITIAHHDGWTTAQMDFQISYCEQMMGNLEEIDGTAFCLCFLDKIQYYYDPIYVRDAYDDQQKWNQQCYEEAFK